MLEETAPLVLPFALDVDEKGYERGSTREIEAALFFLFIERERQRMFLSKGATKVTLAAKIYYSAWIAPWKEGRGLIIDSFGLFPKAIYYDEIPDCRSFHEEAKKVVSAEEYLDLLRRHSLTFFDTKGSSSFIISLISQKDLISELQSYIPQCRRENITSALSLNPRVSWQQVLSFINMLRESEVDIEKLNAVREDLINRQDQWVERQKEAVESIQKECYSRIEEEKAEARIEELKTQCQLRVTELEMRMEEEIKNLSSEKEELQSGIRLLQDKRKEFSKILKNLKRQVEVLPNQLNPIQTKRHGLSRELSNLRTTLEALKSKQLKLEDLAETQKGVSDKLKIMRERLSQTGLDINKTTQLIANLEREVRQEDEKRETVEESIAKLRRQMTDTAKMMKDIDVLVIEKQSSLGSIPHQIEDVKRRRHEEILKIDKDFRLKIDRVRERADILESEMTQRIRVERKKMSEIIRRTDDITSQIDRLIELKSLFINSFQDAAIFLPKNLETDMPILIQIPIYLVCYKGPNERRYKFYSPITVKCIRNILSMKMSIETRMKNFDKDVKGQLEEMTKQDVSFENEVLNYCTKLNLLEKPEMLEVLLKGFTQLKLRRWIATSEADKATAIFSKYAQLPKEDQKNYDKSSQEVFG